MAYTTIDNPALFFNTVLYTGDGTSSRNITGVGFQPDWVWLKQRNTTRNHALTDSVRGVNKQIYSNLTSSQSTDSGTVTAFISDGFTVGSDNQANQNSGTFVSWNWLAGGTSSSNSDGDVTSTVSANQTAGFSIATVSNLNSNSFGHGLGAEPELIINKRTDNTANWRVYFKGITSGKSLFLNTSAGETTESSAIASANSTTITVTGSGNGGTGGTGTSVYYSFKSIKGYSKIGAYTGNGSTSGPFVYTGFKPAWVMMKRTNGSNSWNIFDNKRATDNPVQHRLFPDTTDAEATSTGNAVDFLSNGFVGRSSGSTVNADGGTYIYMAFAEAPFVTEGTKAAGTAR
tara:strand:+ start:1183 stop:2217 length:1035 start_codon:yes stop_codon:yes gene_type:complete